MLLSVVYHYVSNVDCGGAVELRLTIPGGRVGGHRNLRFDIWSAGGKFGKLMVGME